MLQLADKDFKEAIIIMLSGIKEYMKYTENLGREIDYKREPNGSSII